MVTIIAACSNDFVIGVNNELPWILKGDLNFFKKTTVGNIVIMGRNTYDSIGKALPNRSNIVITHNPGDILDALTTDVYTVPDGNIFIIGGAQIYKNYFPVANRLLLTRVYVDIDDIFATRLEGYNPDEWVKVKNIGDYEEKGVKYNISEYKRSGHLTNEVTKN